VGKETLGSIVGSCWALKVCTACCAEWALGGTNAAGAACSFPRKNLDGWGGHGRHVNIVLLSGHCMLRML